MLLKREKGREKKEKKNERKKINDSTKGDTI